MSEGKKKGGKKKGGKKKKLSSESNLDPLTLKCNGRSCYAYNSEGVTTITLKGPGENPACVCVACVCVCGVCVCVWKIIKDGKKITQTTTAIIITTTTTTTNKQSRKEGRRHLNTSNK